jgi:hypothetical protein
MTLIVSDRLYQQLVAWRDDVNSVTPSAACRATGLCKFVGTEVQRELRVLLFSEFCDAYWPFNEHSRDHYAMEEFKNLNPQRRAWVDKKIAEYEYERALNG